jgi:putative PIG3 family NAD(P)H quinone oxidoreductase
MKAIVFDAPGEEDVLRLGEVPAPEPGPEQLRIRVTATAVNRADLLQRRGLYPAPAGASEILGLECAGEVVEVASPDSLWQPGDRVMAILAGGGYAEQVVVHEGSVLPVPGTMSDEQAAGFMETFLTAYLNLFLLAGIERGETVLVHGGGGGVGTAAVTLVRRAGVTSIVTAGSSEKCWRCREHGADVVINYREHDFGAKTRAATYGKGVDVILDSIGGEYLAANLDCLAVDGRLLIIGLMGGRRTEIDLAGVVSKRQQIIGSTLRARSDPTKAMIVDSFAQRFGEDLNAGALLPVVDRVLPLERAAEAHRVVHASEHFGKVVLSVSPRR